MGNKNFNEFQEFIDNINSNLKSRKKLLQLEKYKNNRYNLNQLVENSLKNIPNEIINYYSYKNKKKFEIIIIKFYKSKICSNLSLDIKSLLNYFIIS